MRAPVPHVERVHAVVGVRRPVEVDVPGVLGVRLLELRLDRRRIGRFDEHFLEEVDVARVVQLAEFVGTGWYMINAPPWRTNGFPRYMLK